GQNGISRSLPNGPTVSVVGILIFTGPELRMVIFLFRLLRQDIVRKQREVPFIHIFGRRKNPAVALQMPVRRIALHSFPVGLPHSTSSLYPVAIFSLSKSGLEYPVISMPAGCQRLSYKNCSYFCPETLSIMIASRLYPAFE